MTVPYFPLIGIDRDRNEHPFEWPGLNAKDAAKKGAQRYGYPEVLSNVADQKRSGNGHIYNRMPLFKDETASFKSPADKSALAQLLAEKLKQKAPKDIRSLIDTARARGMTFTVTEKQGKRPTLHITALAHSTVEKSTLDTIRDLARDHVALFIEALEAEKAPPAEPPPPTDPLKGKTQQELVLQILPQMPKPFTLNIFIERVKAAGYVEYAQDRSKMQNAVTYAIKKGRVISAGHGKYAVVDQHRHINGEAPKDPIIESTPPPITPVQEPEPEVPLQIPRTVIEVPPPEPVLNMQALTATVLDLASQAASARDDDIASLAAALNEACKLCESTVLDAVSALTDKVQLVVERLNKQAAARHALIRSLTPSG